MSRKKLIMHSSVFLLVCVFSLNIQCQINPIFIINAKNIKYEGTYRISYLNCNSNILDIQFTKFYWYGDLTYAKFEYNIYDTFLIHYDLRNNVFGEKENCDAFLYSNEELIKEASSVIIDNRFVCLEDSHIPTIIHGDYYYDQWTEYKNLDIAVLSPNKKKVGGITVHRTKYNDPFYVYDETNMHLWNAATGRVLINIILDNGSHTIFFSPKGNYLIGRYATYNFTYQKDFIAFNVILINTETLKVFEAESDVAFTADEKFFVTERNGAPTLVLAKEDVDLLRYSMPYPMISAAFSPDDKHVYIAGADNKIYVFESGVDSGCENWEVME